MQTTIQIDITAPAAIIFAYLTQPEYLLKWQTLLSSAKKRTEGAVGIGTEFALQMDIGKQFPQAESILKTTTIDLEGTVTHYTADERLKIVGESEFNQFSFSYELEALGEAHTRLTQESTLDFKHPLLKALEPLFRGWLQQRGEQDLQQLRALLETE